MDFMKFHLFYRQYATECEKMAIKYGVSDPFVAVHAIFENGNEEGIKIVEMAAKAEQALKNANSSVWFAVKKHLGTHANDKQICEWIEKLLNEKGTSNLLAKCSSVLLRTIAATLNKQAEEYWWKSVYILKQ